MPTRPTELTRLPSEMGLEFDIACRSPGRRRLGEVIALLSPRVKSRDPDLPTSTKESASRGIVVRRSRFVTAGPRSCFAGAKAGSRNRKRAHHPQLFHRPRNCFDCRRQRKNHRRRIEVGLVGFEGMTGLAVVLGNDRSPNENFMQVGGEGRRISADRLRVAMRESRSMQRAFLAFAHAFMNQISSTALSNGTSSIEACLARWLLMAHDRLDDNTIPLTHEFVRSCLACGVLASRLP